MTITRVYGSGRMYIPTAQAIQPQGKAYLWGDRRQMVPTPPFECCSPVAPACAPPTAYLAPRNPDPYGTDVVGGGVLMEKPWAGWQATQWDYPRLSRASGAVQWALPGYMAREPEEGWWQSEAVDVQTGQPYWTTVGGLGGLGATLPTYLRHPTFAIAMIVRGDDGSVRSGWYDKRTVFTTDVRRAVVFNRLGADRMAAQLQALLRGRAYVSVVPAPDEARGTVGGLGGLGAGFFTGTVDLPLLGGTPRWILLGLAAAGAWWWFKGRHRKNNPKRGGSVDRRLDEYARLTAADTGEDIATSRRMMLDEPGEVMRDTGVTRRELDAWFSRRQSNPPRRHRSRRHNGRRTSPFGQSLVFRIVTPRGNEHNGPWQVAAYTDNGDFRNYVSREFTTREEAAEEAARLIAEDRHRSRRHNGRRSR